MTLPPIEDTLRHLDEVLRKLEEGACESCVSSYVTSNVLRELEAESPERKRPTVGGPRGGLRGPARAAEGLAAQPFLLRSLWGHGGQRRSSLPARRSRLRRGRQGRRSPAGHEGDALLLQLVKVVLNYFLSL